MKIRKEKKEIKRLMTRERPVNESDYVRRNFSVRLNDDGKPKTLDEDQRAVDVIASTENPARVLDYETWEIINEVLLMSGAKIPSTKKLPLLDSHDRWTTDSIIGSVRNLRVEDGNLLGRVFLADDAKSDSAWRKIRSGHLTDFSIGYSIDKKKTVRVDAGETKEVDGKTFTGPVVIRKSWKPMELSAVAIGADEKAKARAETGNENINKKNKEKKTMNREQIVAMLKKMGVKFDDDATDEDLVTLLEKSVTEKPEKPDKKKPEPKETRGKQEEEVDTTPPEPEIDLDAERREAAVAERERIAEITKMCERFGFENMIGDMIIKGTSVENARKMVHDRFDQTYQKTEDGQIGFAHAPKIVEDEADKFRAAAVDSILIRVNNSAKKEKLAPGAEDLHGLTLKELARESLRVAGEKPPAGVLDMVGRALTVSDFPNIMSSVANKFLFQGYDQAEETWSVWADTGSAPDFKTLEFPWASEVDDLEEIPEGTEYKYSDLADRKESVQIVTYGKIIAFTRQAIINDDLAVLTDIPMKQGQAVARKIGDVVYAVLTANDNMSDSNPLFDSTHANIATGGDLLPPGVASIAEGIRAMKVQKNQNGLSRLNIRPRYFIAPAALEGSSEVFFMSDRFSDHSTVATDSSFASTRVNPYAGAYFTRVYDARLDDNSEKYWYLAGPKGQTVRVFFLNGVMAPYLESKAGWNVDGTEMKVRIDCAAKALDWKAMYLNPDT